MSGSVPYLGSKISLISKAEIRYEGVLYTIDPNESTVALAKVKSFGTEDRPTDRPVPPRDEIFEYIIFRGRDIKDLHVCAPPQMVGLQQDPAIVQSSEPSVLGGVAGLPNQPGFGSPSYGPGVDLSVYRQPPPGLQPLPQHSKQQQQQQLPQGAFESNQSVTNQPSFGSPKAPSAASADNSPSQSEAISNQSGGHLLGAGDQLMENERQVNASQRHQRRSQPSADGYSQYSGRNQGYMQSPSGYVVRNQGYSSEFSNRSQHGLPRGRGRTRGRGYPARGRGGGPRGDGGLRFDGEFDFESSNAQFDKEQIEKELKEKLVIGDKSSHSGDGDVEADEEEAGDNDPETPVFYDKAKSFFDSISCEALDKSRGGGRPNWREERKVNVETFGFSGGYNRRGGRGRGGAGRGYYGRGRGGGGGWNSGYRGSMGYYNRGPSRNRSQGGGYENNNSGMTTTARS